MAVVHSATAGGSAARKHAVSFLGGRPRHVQPLPGEAVARAADQARIEAPSLYSDLGIGARVVASELATAGRGRGQQVLRQCGKRVAARTVIVDLFLPRGLPSASLSQGTVFISLSPSGYRVWEVAH
jgi:hypothetical protein